MIFMGYTQKHDAKISQSDPINNKTQKWPINNRDGIGIFSFVIVAIF